MKKLKTILLTVLLGSFVFGLSSCGSNIEAGARSVDAMMITYFNALSTKDIKVFRSLFPPLDLSWGVYDDADRSDEKDFRKAAKEKLEALERSFSADAEEFGGVKVSATNLKVEPEQSLQVVWSAEPYGIVPIAVATADREGLSYSFIFSNIKQYRGKYYLESMPVRKKN